MSDTEAWGLSLLGLLFIIFLVVVGVVFVYLFCRLIYWIYKRLRGRYAKKQNKARDEGEA